MKRRTFAVSKSEAWKAANSARKEYFSPSGSLTESASSDAVQHSVQEIFDRTGRFRLTKAGKYSKRRRSNVAVIIVRIIFISLFLFYCLLLNHSFQTNPNSITNCFKLILSVTTYNYIAPASLFDF